MYCSIVHAVATRGLRNRAGAGRQSIQPIFTQKLTNAIVPSMISATDETFYGMISAQLDLEKRAVPLASFIMRQDSEGVTDTTASETLRLTNLSPEEVAVAIDSIYAMLTGNNCSFFDLERAA
jgi:hypothetical protein